MKSHHRNQRHKPTPTTPCARRLSTRIPVTRRRKLHHRRLQIHVLHRASLHICHLAWMQLQPKAPSHFRSRGWVFVESVREKGISSKIYACAFDSKHRAPCCPQIMVRVGENPIAMPISRSKAQRLFSRPTSQDWRVKYFFADLYLASTCNRGLYVECVVHYAGVSRSSSLVGLAHILPLQYPPAFLVCPWPRMPCSLPLSSFFLFRPLSSSFVSLYPPLPSSILDPLFTSLRLLDLPLLEYIVRPLSQTTSPYQRVPKNQR